MLKSCKYLFGSLILAACFGAGAKDLTILVVGQSMSANSGGHVYREPVKGLYQIDLEGRRVPAKDPLLWASSDGGSLWMPLGRKILQAKLADSVTFMPIGKGGTSLENWLTPGSYVNGKMYRALEIIERNNIKFDYVFFLQGSSDVGTPMKDYATRFYTLHHIIQGRLKKSGSDPAWIIARHTRCGDLYDADIVAVQHAIGRRDNQKHYFVGPDTNPVAMRYRRDRCHLNQAGQELVSDMWLQSLKEVMQKQGRKP
ncbi:MAG: sialate O-acetylesterase [Neisseria sp.]|nr:sialate O-acetylesterase [Neisseria sp.]